MHFVPGPAIQTPFDRHRRSAVTGPATDTETGHFSPYSWWAVFLGAGFATVVLRLAIGFWISAIGLGYTTVCIICWIFRYYRVYHERLTRIPVKVPRRSSHNPRH
jgi:hypothetical protein